MKNIIIYSHGFGVRKDDRGLFTDIANSLPDMQHEMFDYNEFNGAANTLTARPLDEQATMLNEIVEKIGTENPNATIDIIAHSQGCVAAAIAKPVGIRKILLLAPPAKILGLEKKHIFANRPETTTAPDDSMHMPRRDGSTTIIRDDYWRSREGIKPIELYNQLADTTSITIITATKDEVLTDTDFSSLSPHIKRIELPASHDFTGEQRKLLLDTIQSIS